jgi:DNA-binding IscR family transcriptional regulator
MAIVVTQQGMTTNEIKNQLNHIKEIIQKTGLFLHNHLASCSVTQVMDSAVDKTLILANLQIGDNVVTLDELAKKLGISLCCLNHHLYTLRKQGYIVTNGKYKSQPYCIKRLK